MLCPIEKVTETSLQYYPIVFDASGNKRDELGGQMSQRTNYNLDSTKFICNKTDGGLRFISFFQFRSAIKVNPVSYVTLNS
ncbi:hypothetical protein WA1_37805 [Scytonema hofmannii PCC 7110]|uniref:Uncharacterized protein n=1 Tax=Scytonema hofmannii PCC 7110 TaxID=128403 RepID=A0A139X077_9CYAN|nr:hypothetical protein WA1_37805 [Scytonema hofmannii PCC 7110]